MQPYWPFPRHIRRYVTSVVKTAT